MALRALGSVLCHDTVQVMPRRMLIGGHRGVGENLWRESEGSVAPAYRENTIKSFLRAEKLGVDFVEFDVQVIHGQQIGMQRGSRGCPASPCSTHVHQYSFGLKSSP